MADQEAKQAAEIIEVKALSLIPDGKIQTMYMNQKPNYTKEDLKLIEDLKGKMKPDRWVYLKNNCVIIPSNLTWPIVFTEHNKTHWGEQVTQQCSICLRNNPNTRNRIKFGIIGKGNLSGTTVVN